MAAATPATHGRLQIPNIGPTEPMCAQYVRTYISVRYVPTIKYLHLASGVIELCYYQLIVSGRVRCEDSNYAIVCLIARASLHIPLK